MGEYFAALGAAAKYVEAFADPLFSSSPFIAYWDLDKVNKQKINKKKKIVYLYIIICMYHTNIIKQRYLLLPYMNK